MCGVSSCVSSGQPASSNAASNRSGATSGRSALRRNSHGSGGQPSSSSMLSHSHSQAMRGYEGVETHSQGGMKGEGVGTLFQPNFREAKGFFLAVELGVREEVTRLHVRC